MFSYFLIVNFQSKCNSSKALVITVRKGLHSVRETELFVKSKKYLDKGKKV